MTGLPYRLALDHEKPGTGRLIDRSRPLTFTFDGIVHHGFAGDTLASALLANGVRVVARSPKFHRPRSFLTAGPEEPNGLVSVGTGARMTPNERATVVELHDGLTARSQNRWPSLEFDCGQILNALSRMLPAGFQNKTFMWPRWAWPGYERVIRQAAGAGPAPDLRDSDSYEHMHAACDVLVAGGGIAGIAAALAAMETGARVIIAEQAPRFGGVSDLFDGMIDGQSSLEWMKQSLARLAASDRVHVLARTTVSGIYEDNLAILDERFGDNSRQGHEGRGTPRERLWKVRAKEIIVAAGALERPLTFANNDRPGVMLGSAVRAYAGRFAVSPGASGVVFTNNDDGYRTACMLDDIKVAVARIIDVRSQPEGHLVEEVRKRGIEISGGHGIATVETSFSGKEIRAVWISPLAGATGKNGRQRIACDFVSSSGGWDPQAHLTAYCGGRLKWDDTIASMKPGSMGARMQAVGAANGKFALKTCLREGYAAGERAARRSRGESAANAGGWARQRVTETSGQAIGAFWQVPPTGDHDDENRQFVDQAGDVTVADIKLAVSEGYDGAEHLKRYTALGMAADQGKTGNINARGIHAEATGEEISKLGTTTLRPPYLPLTFGAMAGSRVGDQFRPVRLSPVWHWHRNNGASFEPVGLWHCPFAYDAGHSTGENSVATEVLSMRQGVGMFDSSTLGKIEIHGPDAAEFLDRMFCTAIANLDVGRCRYGLMLDEQGFIIDDGVVARLAGDHFLVHTTSGRAEQTHFWFERWHQSEWASLEVFITPVTEQWAQFLLAGPKSRDVLECLEGGSGLVRASLPALSNAQGQLAGVPVRIFRTGYTGDLNFEIAAPANFASGLWDAIMEAGQPSGITAFGTQALHLMRLEQGHIAVGEETDGTVTPFDLGLGRLVASSKSDFIGRLGLQRSALQRPDRRQLVGLSCEERPNILPQGGYLIEADDREQEPPHRMIGHITSSGWSPTLDRSIALALVERGRERIGQTIACPVGRETVVVKIAEPVFRDSEPDRRHS